MMSDYKELGKIENAKFYYEDHGCLWTCGIGIEFNGFYQSFGHLSLDENLARIFANKVCNLFQVKDLQDLIGKNCYGLWSLNINNEPLAGIATLSGEKFTISQFRQKHFPNMISLLEGKRKSYHSTMNWALRRYEDAKKDLEELESKWVDWDTKSVI